MNTKCSSALIISLQGIGNTILALPAIKLYAERNTLDISMIVSDSGFQKVLERFVFIKDIYLWDENKAFFANIINLKNKLSKYVFDEAFAVGPYGRRDNFSLFLSRSAIKKGVYYKEAYLKMFCFLNPKGLIRETGWHDAEANARLFGFSEKEFNSIDLKPLISEEERNYARGLLNRNSPELLITLHPGALSARNAKMWPIEKYRELCNRIIEKYNCRFVLIGGSEELDIRNEIGNGLKNNPVILQNETLPQTIAVMNETDLFLGNDSGPMHIAAALDLPMIVLLGCANYDKTSPLSDSCLLVRRKLPCSPCYNSTKSGPLKCEHDFHCIKGMDVDEVLLILKEYLDFIISHKKVDSSKMSLNHGIVDSMIRLKSGPLLVDLKSRL